MKITAITAQKRNTSRVNVYVDGIYKFSLDTYQLVDLGIRVGKDYDEAELLKLEQESQFGKVYSRALEYCLIRPHSAREVKDYLYRKTRSTRDKTGEISPGISPEITSRVFERLEEKNYIDDKKFARYWIENRSVTKGTSFRKLISELRSKGITMDIIEEAISETSRSDGDEIKKIITKKRSHYPDNQKFIAYLARLGFSYDLIKQELDI